MTMCPDGVISKHIKTLHWIHLSIRALAYQAYCSILYDYMYYISISISITYSPWLFIVVGLSINVGKTTINHPPNHHFYRWYVYHSQLWVVYGIVFPTLTYPRLRNNISNIVMASNIPIFHGIWYFLVIMVGYTLW